MLDFAQRFLADRHKEHAARLCEQEVRGALDREIWRSRGKILSIISRARAFRGQEPLFEGAWFWDPEVDCDEFLIGLVDSDEAKAKELRVDARPHPRIEITGRDTRELGKAHAQGLQRSFLTVYKLNKEGPKGGKRVSVWDLLGMQVGTPALALAPR